MFYNNINPVLLHLGPLEIRYYGLFFVAGIFFSYWLVGKLLKERNIDLGKEGLSELALYLVFGLLIGARIGSVLSESSYYIANPLQVFALWQGGLAFHGGLVGMLIAGYLFVKKKKIDFMVGADIVVIPVALALALGRVGNFTNSEFYGTITNLPWGVKFFGVEGFRHPVQLYEALKNLFIFGLLWWLKDKKLPVGFLFWTFVTAYGLLRFWLEFYKDLPPLLLNLTWGQVWSLPMIIIGGYMLIKLWNKRRH
jgi:phosphatidylglycerol:prolipoprotein diacylglycerol transferase